MEDVDEWCLAPFFKDIMDITLKSRRRGRTLWLQSSYTTSSTATLFDKNLMRDLVKEMLRDKGLPTISTTSSFFMKSEEEEGELLWLQNTMADIGDGEEGTVEIRIIHKHLAPP
ncbi:hypothetical protein RhiirA1_462614 [Rhizophagus irregularis]|uniref:Uncharacterized protein n=1 Tax=Rhizophagus irregularis TaxID=588596 RepID=A0A2N0RLW4_9GLOM|nr:hypothetical protein RhiirA1_462614 [Rhizophagus irregularis]